MSSLHRNNCICTVYMQLVRNVSNYITRMHHLPSSDEMIMSYTEHDF